MPKNPSELQFSDTSSSCAVPSNAKRGRQSDSWETVRPRAASWCSLDMAGLLSPGSSRRVSSSIQVRRSSESGSRQLGRRARFEQCQARAKCSDAYRAGKFSRPHSAANHALPENIRAKPSRACPIRAASMFSGSGTAMTGRFVCGSVRTSRERTACPVGGEA